MRAASMRQCETGARPRRASQCRPTCSEAHGWASQTPRCSCDAQRQRAARRRHHARSNASRGMHKSLD
eukprot:6174866-Pleurochrysis_carterae.AAC.1